MSRTLEFHLPFPAIGKESVRGGGSYYIPDKTRSYMKQVSSIFSKTSLSEPFSGPICVEISCFWKRPSTGDPESLWMTRKPDVDNIEKAIYDAGSKILWQDDAQIVVSITKKLWGAKDFILVNITPF